MCVVLRKGAIDSMGKERARENREEFCRRAIEERIEVILGENREPARKFYREADRIMEGLDPENRLKFEEFLSEYQLFSGKESRLIYLGGLTDGLRLGVMAFAECNSSREQEEE